MSGLCLKLPGRRRQRSAWSPPVQKSAQGATLQSNRRYVVRQENMPVGMEVTEDTPPDMFTGSMNLKLVLPSGKKIKTSVDRSTPMMDLLVHVTTCHKLSPAAHVLQPYGDRGVLPYKPSTPIGALDTVMVHIVPKNQLAQNQSNKMALKQVSQPFEQTYRIQVSLPRNQLYVLRANGRTTIADIHSEICNEKNLDPSKYSLRHPKELSTELKNETTIAEYKSNQLVLVCNRSNPPHQLSTDDIINAIQNINKNNNNNIYAFEPSSRSLSPDSSVSPVAEPPKPLRKKKPPAPKPPVSHLTNQKSSKEKTVDNGTGRVICHSRTSSDSSGYHEASLLSESPPSNNSSLPDSLPRRSKLDSKVKVPSDSSGRVTQNPALSKSLSDLKVSSMEPPSISSHSAQTQSSLKPAQSTTSLNTARKKRLAPPPPPTSAPPPMRTVIEERISLNSELSESSVETVKERSRTLEPDRRAVSGEVTEKCRTLPPGMSINSVEQAEKEVVQREDTIPDEEETPLPVAVAPPDERDLVMEDEEIDRIFNNATADHGSSLVHPTRAALTEANDSGRDSTDSNEVHRSVRQTNIPSPIAPPRVDSPDTKLPEFPRGGEGIVPVGLSLPSPVKTIPETVPESVLDWEYKLPAPPTFRDPPESDIARTPELSERYERSISSSSDSRADMTPRSAVMSELSSLISQKSSSDILNPVVEQAVKNTSTLDNFKITTYQPTSNTSSTNDIVSSFETKTSVRRNNSLIRESNSFNNYDGVTTNRPLSYHGYNSNPTVKRSVSHVSLFVRPYDNLRSKTLERSDDRLKGVLTSSTLRKTSSEFNIDSVGKKVEKNTADSQDLQTLQVLRTILPQLSQSQGSLNAIAETEQVNNPEPQPIVQKPQSRYERDTKVAVSLATWGERPKRQVSIKSDRDYVFGQGGATCPRKSPVDITGQKHDVSPSLIPPVNLHAKPPVTAPIEPITRHESTKSIPEEDVLPSKNETIDSNPDIQLSEDDKRPKRIMNVYKSLETGNTKPLRQILNEVSRVPVVKSVELKSPYKEWQVNQSQNRGLDRLREKFETENKNTKETSAKMECENFESTDRIRERFETAIKERYETVEKMHYTRRESVEDTAEKDSSSKLNINSQKQRNNDTNIPPTNKIENTIKYESKVRINQTDNQNQPKNKMISQTKIEPNENRVKTQGPLTNRYTSVIGIGGPEDEVVRVRVKTSSTRPTIVSNQRQTPITQIDPREQLLTSIRGFGGLESLKKVRS